jgi:NAD(P)-dependent dehydrogenase (short-subunit alcohol dehydrogenase family)
MGREACAVFASEGARVAAVDIDPELLEATEAAVHATDGEIALFVADVAVEDQVRGAVEGAVERFGALHILYNTQASCGAIATCPSSRPTRTSGIACSRST